MTKTSAGAADVLRFVFDDKDETSLQLHEDGSDDDDSTDSSGFGNWWNWRECNIVETVDEEDAAEVHALPVRKKTRNVYARKQQVDSTWSNDYWTLTLRDMYVLDPRGRDAKKFRRLFRVPYDLFVDLVQLSNERWWRDWTPDKVCNAGKPVSSQQLRCMFSVPVLLSTRLVFKLT
jgi:hypothetical protein